MRTVTEIEHALAQCYGTMQYWKGQLLPFKYTDGVKTMWEMCDAYWLLIAIGSYRRKESFQVWELKVNQDTKKAVLTMCEDSGKPYKVTQKIPYTDFPLDKMELWIEDGVLILPNEH